MTNITSLCSLCNEDVHNYDKALNCDLCDTWEHQDCIRQVDHLSKELHCSTFCISKSIVFVWTAHKHKGSLNKRLHAQIWTCMQTSSCWPANGCLRSGNRWLVKCLLEDKLSLISEENKLSDEFNGTKKLPLLLVPQSIEMDNRLQSSTKHSGNSKHND